MTDTRIPIRYESEQQEQRWRTVWLAATRETRQQYGPWLRAQLDIRMNQLEEAQ